MKAVLLPLISVALVTGVLITGCTTSSLRTEDRDIAALIAASNRRQRAWEWEGDIPEVTLVAKHGRKIAPKLLALLDERKDEPTDSHMQPDQDVMLALCRIYGEPPTMCRTVYGVRCLEAQNRKAYEFWHQRVIGGDPEKKEPNQ